MRFIPHNQPRVEGLAGYIRPKKARSSQQLSDASSVKSAAFGSARSIKSRALSQKNANPVIPNQ
jgi:hypothetical protein